MRKPVEQDLYDLIDVLVEAVPFEQGKVEVLLQAKLHKTGENAYFDFYEGESAYTHGKIGLRGLDVRIRKEVRPDAQRGFLMFSLVGGCVSAKRMLLQYESGAEPIVGVHPLRNLYYQVRVGDVLVRFGVETDTDCITQVVIDPVAVAERGAK